MRIHKEGRTIILLTIVVLLVVNGLAAQLLPILLPFTGLGSLVVMGLMLNFFRDPIRKVPKLDDQLIYSPADGTVVTIEEVDEPEYFGDKRLQISVFMSIYDVHANCNPISGRVAYYKYHPGLYLLARHPKSSTENERNTTVIKNAKGVVLFRQIAGAVARRIRVYIEEGQSVRQGEQMGFIKFGSRVDLFLPLDAKVNVKIGDKTTAGQTVLAEF